MSTCATCDGYFFRGKPIAVVGGGDSAMEEAIYLTRFASKVTVIHRRDTLRASKIMQDKAFANAKIEFIWDSEIADIKDVERGEVTGIIVRNLKTGEADRRAARRRLHRHRPHAEHRALPRSDRARRQPATSSRITARRRACPGVFAAGDVQDHIYRQAITAAGSGCMAAIDAERYIDGLPIPDETTDNADCLIAPPLNDVLKP